MKFKHLLLTAAALVTAAGLAGAQVGRTPNFGDSFIRDAGSPVNSAQVNTSGQLATSVGPKGSTYSAAVSGLVVASGSGDAIVIGGSATRIVRVHKITFSGRATAVVTSQVVLIKRSSAPVNGTGTVVALLTPLDANLGAATATISTYTAAPTNGTIVGPVRDVAYTYADLTTGVGQGPYSFTFEGGPVVLRSATQTLSVQLPHGGPSGNSIDATIEWTESTD